MEKKLARLFADTLSVFAMIFGTLIYGIGEWWFAVCDIVDEGAIQIIWKAECFPYYLGNFGQRLGELLMVFDEKFWNLNVYKEAPVAIFLAGVVGLVLTILSSKLAIYPRSKLASFFLWPLFLFVGEGMTQFEKKLCFKYAFSGGLLTAFCMVIWITMV